MPGRIALYRQEFRIRGQKLSPCQRRPRFHAVKRLPDEEAGDDGERQHDEEGNYPAVFGPLFCPKDGWIVNRTATAVHSWPLTCFIIYDSIMARCRDQPVTKT
jgi:hypothetical protein